MKDYVTQTQLDSVKETFHMENKKIIKEIEKYQEAINVSYDFLDRSHNIFLIIFVAVFSIICGNDSMVELIFMIFGSSSIIIGFNVFSFCKKKKNMNYFCEKYPNNVNLLEANVLQLEKVLNELQEFQKEFQEIEKTVIHTIENQINQPIEILKSEKNHEISKQVKKSVVSPNLSYGKQVQIEQLKEMKNELLSYTNYQNVSFNTYEVPHVKIRSLLEQE